MASKRIDLGAGLSFDSIAAAKLHFDPMRTDGPVDVHLAQNCFAELKALYDEYCRKTNYNLPAPVVAFYPTMEKEAPDTHDASALVFRMGRLLSFLSIKP